MEEESSNSNSKSLAEQRRHPLADWFRPDNHLPPLFAVEDDGCDGSRCCAVCLNDVIGGDSCRKLPKCGHIFRVECVDAWLQCNWTCPLCRKQVTDQLPKQQGENTILNR
ncbi:E3 ubiquitin-protein ligase RHA1B-like [Nicotiana tomentosiformis]|uniref:E3 ubiquitin-protein ligase RHA1B-like n=1 Tax=Nicotiana tomentosiformis TaxID=4098 RepID=UPI00388CEA43